MYLGVLQFDNGDMYGVVWKNGVVSYLTEGTTFSYANTLIVSGQNIHVGGYIISGWKNVRHILEKWKSSFASFGRLFRSH